MGVGWGPARFDHGLLGAYLEEFESPTGSADKRKAATVNHRLSVLGTFFSFLARRDRERGVGAWVDRSK